MDIYSLPSLSVLSDFITTCQLENINIVRIDHPKARAAISLFGGHVISYQPANEQDTIWMSDKVILSGEKPLRGGIPVCWPWFGKAAEPAHGFARNKQWQINQHRENEQGVVLSLGLTDDEHSRAIWPYQFNLELRVEVTDSLKISLITTNLSNESFEFGGALHSYFAVADINQTEVNALGDHYTEFGSDYASTGIATFSQEVDRIYTKPEAVTCISDHANQRTIEVTHAGNSSVVVWNPWQALSTSMADMADDGYQTMVCVESALHERSIKLESQQSHSLSATIRVIR